MNTNKHSAAIVTLTTVPSRLLLEHEYGLSAVLHSLCKQTYTDYEVHFNIPHIYNVTKEEYIIPDWLISLEKQYKHLKIFRTEDYGPPTKFVPTLHRVSDPETIIIVADDDLIYRNEMVSEHIKYQSQLDGVIGYDGRGRYPAKYNDLRDSWILCTTEIVKTSRLQHYKTVSYKRKIYEQDFFDLFLGKTKSDDILLWYYCLYKGITHYVVPYEPENHLYTTYELWGANQGVTSFPVIQHSMSPQDTGCNHPILLQQEPKFFIPVEFEQLTINKEHEYFTR